MYTGLEKLVLLASVSSTAVQATRTTKRRHIVVAMTVRADLLDCCAEQLTEVEPVHCLKYVSYHSRQLASSDR